MLHDGAGGPVELEHGGQGGVEINDVVVGKLLAAELPRACQRDSPEVRVGIERSGLVRVLSVAQRLQAVVAENERGGELLERLFLLEVAAHPAIDGGVVGGGVLEGLHHKLGAQGTRHAAGGAQALDDTRVVGGINKNHDVAEVLRRRAHHAGAADVYVLDGVFLGDAGPGHGLAERIEVDADEVNRLDAVRLDGGFVLGVAADVQNAAVHLRVKRLDPAIHHLRKARKVADVAHAEARIAQRLCRAAGGNEVHAQVREVLREINDSRLVRDADERPFHSCRHYLSSPKRPGNEKRPGRD